MGFKTFASGDVLTAADVNDYLMEQAVIGCTSATRPGSPQEGMTVYETDTDQVKVYNGSAWKSLYIIQTAVFSKSGTLAVATGTHRLYFPMAVTIIDAWAAVGTAPTGAALIVDVNHGGTTIFTTQGNRPQIAVSTNYDLSSTADGDVTVAAGEYLTVDIDQVGSTVAGSDLTVGVRYTVD